MDESEFPKNQNCRICDEEDPWEIALKPINWPVVILLCLLCWWHNVLHYFQDEGGNAASLNGVLNETINLLIWKKNGREIWKAINCSKGKQ